MKLIYTIKTVFLCIAVYIAAIALVLWLAEIIP